MADVATVSFENFRKNKPNNKKNKPYIFKKKKKPLVLVFDEKEREEFLTGFRKRKLQRKKKAQEDLEVQVKAERKRIKLAAKDSLKKLVVSHRDIPELANINQEADVVDMGTHEVQVMELDPARLARENNWIGTNQIKSEEPDEVDDEPNEEEDNDENEIEGMETKVKKIKSNKTKENDGRKIIKTKKEANKLVQKLVTKNIQKSKVLQKKKGVEAVKNKKKKMREERKREKVLKQNKSKRRKRQN